MSDAKEAPKYILSNNNDAPSTAKCGFLVRQDAQIVALRAHRAQLPPYESLGLVFLGAFSHSANYYVVYPGDTPENHQPTEGCMINSKQHGVQIKTLGPVVSIRLKKNILGVPAGSVGCARCTPFVPMEC